MSLVFLVGLIAAGSSALSEIARFRTNLGYVALVHEREALAGQRFLQAVSTELAPPSAWRGRGKALGAEGQMAQALESYNAALIQQPENGLARLERAELRYALGNHSGAREDWLSIGSVDLLLDLGHAARQSADARSATDFYGMALQVAPHDWRGHYYLAVNLRAEGHTEQAYESARTGLALSPLNPALLFLCGRIEYRLQLPEDALQRFSSYVQVSPQEVRGWIWRGLCWERLGEPERAVLDYEVAVALDVTDSNSRLRLASGLEETGDLCRALEEYEIALSLGDSRARDGVDRLSHVPCSGP